MSDPSVPSVVPELPDSTVHVWLFGLQLSPDAVDACRLFLPRAEREELAMDSSEAESLRRIITRARLRRILAAYLNKSPLELVFSNGPHGKPMLGSENCPPMHFNVTHAGDWAMAAVCRRHPVGIDIERCDGERPCLDIAATIFSRRELESITALPAERQIDAFYTIWTCKEACVKTEGGGMLTAQGGPEIALKEEGPPSTAGRFCLKSWTPRPGYRAALAYPPEIKRVTELDWNDFEDRFDRD